MEVKCKFKGKSGIQKQVIFTKEHGVGTEGFGRQVAIFNHQCALDILNQIYK